MAIKILTSDGIKYLTDKIKTWVTDGFVAKVDGKELTSNDYTDAEKTKLAGIEEGAQVNTIDTAGTGLALDGTTIGHSNSVTAKTTYVGSATTVPRIKYDEQGHVTGTSTATIYPPTTAGESGQVWVSKGSGVGQWKTLVTFSTAEPTADDGSDGDLWAVYE